MLILQVVHVNSTTGTMRTNVSTKIWYSRKLAKSFFTEEMMSGVTLVGKGNRAQNVFPL